MLKTNAPVQILTVLHEQSRHREVHLELPRIDVRIHELVGRGHIDVLESDDGAIRRVERAVGAKVYRTERALRNHHSHTVRKVDPAARIDPEPSAEPPCGPPEAEEPAVPPPPGCSAPAVPPLVELDVEFEVAPAAAVTELPAAPELPDVSVAAGPEALEPPQPTRVRHDVALTQARNERRNGGFCMQEDTAVWPAALIAHFSWIPIRDANHSLL